MSQVRNLFDGAFLLCQKYPTAIYQQIWQLKCIPSDILAALHISSETNWESPTQGDNLTKNRKPASSKENPTASNLWARWLFIFLLLSLDVRLQCSGCSSKCSRRAAASERKRGRSKVVASESAVTPPRRLSAAHLAILLLKISTKKMEKNLKTSHHHTAQVPT